MMRCNAYILSMPGVPCVFLPHWIKYKEEIKKMIDARRTAGVHSESYVEEEAGSGWYRATVYGKHGAVKLMLGSAASDATPDGYKEAVKGTDYAMYYMYSPEGIDEVNSEELGVKSEKFLKDAQLFIRVGEKVYDIQGRQVY